MLKGGAGQLALIYPLAAVAGWLFAQVGVPLPWMIGPLVAVAALYLSGTMAGALPVVTRPFGQAVVASQVGLAFTGEALGMVIYRLPLLVGLALMTAAFALLVSVIQARVARVKLSRMVLATFPVSPVESAIIAESLGIAPAPIIMAQTLRISAIVVILPLLLYAIDGRPAPVEFAGTGGGPVGILLLALAALAGGAVFRALNWVNPFFLGPLAASSALTAAGVPLTPLPDAVLSAGQIVLGAWLGSTFQRKLFEGAGREMLVSIAGTLLLLTLSTAGAVAVARLTGLPWETLILATAPGGVTEMALTARYLQQSVSFVTAAHVVRIFLLMPVARPLVRAIDRRG